MSSNQERLVRGCAIAFACALGACAVSLDDPETVVDEDAPEVLAGCAMRGMTGRVQTLALDDGLLVIADAIETDAGAISNAVFHASRPSDACTLAPTTSAASGLDASALGDDLDASFGAVLLLKDTPYAFVRTSRGFEPLGTALARFDSARGAFVAEAGYLFSAGYPSYGDAALVASDYLYAYGSAGTGFFTEACFVARAPLDRVSDPTAWTYYQDGNVFGADPDDAWPIFDGGGRLALAADGERLVAAYTDPLGDVIRARTGLGPTGPWSPQRAVGRCDLPAGAFCGALSFHPALAPFALSHAVASFDALTTEQRLTRLIPLDAAP